MPDNKTTLRTALAAVVAALSASLCCITPVLALISGATGIAAGLAWLEPLRPFLALVSISVLGFAWYRHFSTRKAAVDCACADGRTTTRPAFLHSRTFLVIITLFATSMLAFPYYAHMFYPEPAGLPAYREAAIREVEFSITGMTCSGCAEHIEYTVAAVAGVAAIRASYEEGGAWVRYDTTLTNAEAILAAINNTGYQAHLKKKE